MSRRGWLRLAVAAVAVVAVAGRADAAGSDENVVVQWGKAALQAVRDTQAGPPVAARSLAITHTCMYDAWTAYDDAAVATRRSAAARRPAKERTPANKSEAVSFAAYRCLSDQFPSQAPAFKLLMTLWGYDPGKSSTDPATPAGVGNMAAQAVLAFRWHDGANQLGDLNPGAYSDYTSYAPVNAPDSVVEPGRWQPLRVPDGRGGFVAQKFMVPHWGMVTPFALSAGHQFRPGPPASFPADKKRYVDQAKQLVAYSAHLTDEQKMIAEYWADGPASETPPGHWYRFGQMVSARDRHTLDDDVMMFFALTNSLFDASIAAWDAKRYYDSVRPITAVRFLMRDETIAAWGGPIIGTIELPGAHWEPYPIAALTPPFPEYVSGHSTFSAAAAEVLQQFTGSDVFGGSTVFRAGSSRVEPGHCPMFDTKLTWATFSDAAEQAGLSRRYAGIHFADGDLEGRKLGRNVGSAVWEKASELFRRQPATPVAKRGAEQQQASFR
jgi:hypothetical protein